jgi:hypothetical protein
VQIRINTLEKTPQKSIKVLRLDHNPFIFVSSLTLKCSDAAMDGKASKERRIYELIGGAFYDFAQCERLHTLREVRNSFT